MEAAFATCRGHSRPFPTCFLVCLADRQAKMTATGIAVGANKGHVVTKRDQAQRPSRRKGVSAKMSLRYMLQPCRVQRPEAAAVAHSSTAAEMV